MRLFAWRSRLVRRNYFCPVLQRIQLPERLIPLNNYSDKILRNLSVNVGPCRSIVYAGALWSAYPTHKLLRGLMIKVLLARTLPIVRAIFLSTIIHFQMGTVRSILWKHFLGGTVLKMADHALCR